MIVNIGGTLENISALWCNIDGNLKRITGGYVNIGGNLRPLSMGTPISDLAVGSSVYINSVEYLIVHQGLPSDLYDASCNGTWLLRKNIYSLGCWEDDTNDYENSNLHEYLNNSFLNTLDDDTRSLIKTVKIPYEPGGGRGYVYSGSSGLSTKVFLLGAREVGSTSAFYPDDGVALDYFTGFGDGSAFLRIAKYNNTANVWMLRSAYNNTADRFGVVTDNGAISAYSVGTNNAGDYGIRPAFVIDSNTKVDSSNNIIGG